MGIVLIVAIVVLIGLGYACSPQITGGHRGSSITLRALLTEREVVFWHLLRRTAAPLHVMPQVAMGALLRTDSRTTRNRFDRKIVDFVLLDDAGCVRLLIELDDRMHDAGRDAERDAMTAQAGYRTLRINGVAARDLHMLTAAVDDALGCAPRWSPPEFSPAISRHRERNR